MFQTLRSFAFRLSSLVAAQASRIAVYSDFAESCRREKVGSVLDIGANRGQFASRLRMAGWEGRIHSFEPIGDLHARLVAAAKNDREWVIADRIALGDVPGRLSLNVASNDGKSSSFLAPEADGPLYGSAFEFVRTEEIDVVTLDQWIASEQPQGPFAIKIDVQGFELHVLEGAKSALERTRIVMLEAPLVSTYENGASFDDLYRFMTSHGFRVANAHASTLNPADGTPLELDIEFVSTRVEGSGSARAVEAEPGR